MANVTPTWADQQSVIAAQGLGRGTTLRGTLDLRAKYGAYLFMRVGRGGTTALTTAVTALVRRVLNNGAAGGLHPAALTTSPAAGLTAAAAGTTVGTDSASGQPAINVVSSASFVAGDQVIVQDPGGGVTRLEWQRVSKVAAGVITFDDNLQYTHTAAQTDSVRNKCDIYVPLWMDGGSLYEVVYDYGASTTGETVTVEAIAQVYSLEVAA